MRKEIRRWLPLITVASLMALPACSREKVRVSDILPTRTPQSTFTPTKDFLPLLLTPKTTNSPEKLSVETVGPTNLLLSPTSTTTPTREIPTAVLIKEKESALELTATLVPAAPATSLPERDFAIRELRLLTNEENGGISQNGSVVGCGGGHNIFVKVMDKTGNPLDGAMIGDTYNNPGHVSGDKGQGKAEYDVYPGGGYELLVKEFPLGRPVASEVSRPMSTNDEVITDEDLIKGHYCATAAECQQGKAQNQLCRGHYSWQIVFQRTK